MISKASVSECFVYITLPGATSATTAGRFVLEKNQQADPLGRCEIEGSHPPLAKPDQKDGSQQNCQKEDNARGDQHVQLPL
jgi:hypothetical protein